MIQILIIIFFLCILAVLYLSKPKWLEKRMPWIWEHIGAPIFRYYFVTTVRKITIIYFSTFGAIAAANPILKLCFKINWNTKNGDIWASLDWGNDWIDITCVILALLLTFLLLLIAFTFCMKGRNYKSLLMRPWLVLKI